MEQAWHLGLPWPFQANLLPGTVMNSMRGKIHQEGTSTHSKGVISPQKPLIPTAAPPNQNPVYVSPTPLTLRALTLIISLGEGVNTAPRLNKIPRHDKGV